MSSPARNPCFRPGIRTRAFKEGRVHYVDPNGWYVTGGGLNNMKAITESLLAAMR